MKTRKRSSSKANKSSKSKEKKSPKKTDKRNGLSNITNTEASENENLLEELVVANISTAGEKQNADSVTKDSKSEPKATTSKRDHTTSPSNANGLKFKRAKLGGTSNSDGNDLERELALFGMIKNVLGKHFYNVVDRLQLDFVPLCIPNIEYCAKNHTKNGDQPNEIDHSLMNDARSFVKEDRPQDFISLVSKLSIGNDFPGSDIILTTLELILTVNEPSHKNYTTDFIIQSATILFENIVNNFPPCWNEIRDSYKKLFHQKLHINLPSNKYNTNEGIFKVVLAMLDNSIQEEHKDSTEDLDESLNFFNVYEQKHKQKYEFEILSKDSKIDRVFIALHLLVKIMETDLAVWMVRHPKNTNITMTKPKKMPLIGYLLWPSEECGQINSLIKTILNLFVINISIGMPKEKIDVLSRLLNLVAHAINLCEIQPNSGEIRFPNIQSHTEMFVMEIKKTIEKIQSCNVDLFLAVIDHIRTPFVKVNAIDQLLMKFNRDVGKPSLKKIYFNFQKKRWAECDEDGERKKFLFVPDASSASKYPVYKPLTEKPKISDIYQKDYLDLVLSAYKSYCHLYQIEAVVSASEKTDKAATVDGSITQYMTEDEYKAKLKKSDKLKLNKFNFAEMEKDITKLENMCLKMASSDYLYYNHLELSMDDIVIDKNIVLKYRDDLKHFFLLREIIDKYYDEYGDIFKDWKNAILPTEFKNKSL